MAVLARPPGRTDAPNDGPLSRVFGRIRDMDSHEHTPARRWVEDFGPAAAGFDAAVRGQSPEAHNSYTALGEDEGPVDPERLPEYWRTAARAPGAYNLRRRVEFLDLVGVSEAFMFGSGPSVFGQMCRYGSPEIFTTFHGLPMEFDMQDMGRSLIHAHNDWCVRNARISPRLRPVAIVQTDTLAQALNETERLLESGVRAITLSTSQLIEGKAPAHTDNDPLWRMVVEANVPVMLHVGSDFGFLAKEAGWINAPCFIYSNDVPTETNNNPYSVSTMFFPPVNYVSNLIFGGVFERFPDLRFGLAEYGAGWLGGFIDNMETWTDMFARRLKAVLSLRPTEYFQRNIRVGVMGHERIDVYLNRYPELVDVYSFESDYPHNEGGVDPMGALAKRLDGMGSDVVEKFFVKNAEWLMPA